MPHFEPAFDMTPNWEVVSNTPSAVVLSFRHHDHPHELHRFIEIFMNFMQLNNGTYDFNKNPNQMPFVRNADGKIVPLPLLSLIKKRRAWIRLSFYFFGDYYREILRMYCMYSLGVHTDEDVRNGFIRVLNDFNIGTEQPTLN